MLLIPIQIKAMGEEEEEEKRQMKKIYQDILFSTDPIDKKKGVKALASYGKQAIPLIQELRDIETNEEMKNYMFDAISQINKGIS
ncbi:MAG: hypothetical protein ACJ73C_10990 [Nitrososphaeraceae archaeon]|jgi:hypothetical protein